MTVEPLKRFYTLHHTATELRSQISSAVPALTSIEGHRLDPDKLGFWQGPLGVALEGIVRLDDDLQGMGLTNVVTGGRLATSQLRTAASKLQAAEHLSTGLGEIDDSVIVRARHAADALERADQHLLDVAAYAAAPDAHQLSLVFPKKIPQIVSNGHGAINGTAARRISSSDEIVEPVYDLGNDTDVYQEFLRGPLVEIEGYGQLPIKAKSAVVNLRVALRQHENVTRHSKQIVEAAEADGPIAFVNREGSQATAQLGLVRLDRPADMHPQGELDSWVAKQVRHLGQELHAVVRTDDDHLLLARVNGMLADAKTPKAARTKLAAGLEEMLQRFVARDTDVPGLPAGWRIERVVGMPLDSMFQAPAARFTA